MSRVHDALRRAESGVAPAEPPVAALEGVRGSEVRVHPAALAPEPVRASQEANLLADAPVVAYRPAPESHMLDLDNSHETPAEEFRTLRTRLNHLQTLQPLHTLIVSSASPAEGKTFVSVNLALAQAQLAENLVLLCDFDLRRPVVHHLFQIDRAPGLSDYLSGQCRFAEALRRIEGANLYVMPAGSPVKNPLELLNTRQARMMFEELPRHFNWAIFDTPPLLFSADANLLSTMADGALLVVRIGATTFDTIARAMQSLCENNVVGIVANGARASELYSKYTYYYSKTD